MTDTVAGSPVRRFRGSRSDLEAAELMSAALSQGATPVHDCCVGEQVMVCGTIRSVTVRPRGRVPAFEAEIYDGSGRLRLVWMGRRRVRGIDPGRMIGLVGRVTLADGVPTIFNPRYRLRPGPES